MSIEVTGGGDGVAGGLPAAVPACRHARGGRAGGVLMDRAAEAAGELEPILALLAGAESAAAGIREQARQDALELGERPR